MKSSHIVPIFTDYIKFFFLILATILKILIYFFLNQRDKNPDHAYIFDEHYSDIYLVLISILKTPAFLLIKSVK